MGNEESSSQGPYKAHGDNGACESTTCSHRDKCDQHINHEAPEAQEAPSAIEQRASDIGDGLMSAAEPIANLRAVSLQLKTAYMPELARAHAAAAEQTEFAGAMLADACMRIALEEMVTRRVAMEFARMIFPDRGDDALKATTLLECAEAVRELRATCAGFARVKRAIFPNQHGTDIRDKTPDQCASAVRRLRGRDVSTPYWWPAVVAAALPHLAPVNANLSDVIRELDERKRSVDLARTLHNDSNKRYLEEKRRREAAETAWQCVVKALFPSNRQSEHDRTSLYDVEREIRGLRANQAKASATR